MGPQGPMGPTGEDGDRVSVILILKQNCPK